MSDFNSAEVPGSTPRPLYIVCKEYQRLIVGKKVSKKWTFQLFIALCWTVGSPVCAISDHH